ncbi:MAG: hypothetical protein DRJ18_01490 [Candidatus Methanomethylicota archaeon]|nr:MAG: hypothetical protein DRJ18_01490 [Candidatus Verstraetearchaeota archaeon]
MSIQMRVRALEESIELLRTKSRLVKSMIEDLVSEVRDYAYDEIKGLTPVARDRPLWGGGTRRGGTLRRSWTKTPTWWREDTCFSKIYTRVPYAVIVNRGRRTTRLLRKPKRSRAFVFYKEGEWKIKRRVTIVPYRGRHFVEGTLTYVKGLLPRLSRRIVRKWLR